MEEKIEIRSACLEDIDALIAAERELFDFKVDRVISRDFFENPSNLFSIAVMADRVLGFASGFLYSHPDKKHAVFMNEVCVHEDFRNQGLGEKLVRHLWNSAQSKGCEYGWIATENNNLSARKAFKNAGGIENSTLVSLIEFGNPDSIINHQ